LLSQVATLLKKLFSYLSCDLCKLFRGNNVGRNAFRIFQVQRAFSDAHCALLAALEWDEEGSDLQAAASSDLVPGNALDSFFSLLKCMLRSSEDVGFDL
jgi:hypothetical protein